MSSDFHFDVAWLALMLGDGWGLSFLPSAWFQSTKLQMWLFLLLVLSIDTVALKSSSLLWFIIFVTGPPSNTIAYIVPSLVHKYFTVPSFCRCLVSISSFCDVSVRFLEMNRFGVLFTPFSLVQYSVLRWPVEPSDYLMGVCEVYLSDRAPAFSNTCQSVFRDDRGTALIITLFFIEYCCSSSNWYFTRRSTLSCFKYLRFFQFFHFLCYCFLNFFQNFIIIHLTSG